MNCKLGILAVVRGCPIHACNDQIVEVVSPSASFRDYGPGWYCTNAAIREQLGGAVPIPDSMLRPIGGVPVNDEQLDEVPA